MQSTINAVAFPVPPRSWSAAVLRRRSDLILLQTASGETTAAVHIVNRRRADSRPLTILYSHANAEDLGLSLPFADVLSRFCGCDVLAYEYLGYSISSGEPSEAGCLECVDAALAYLPGQEKRAKFPTSKAPISAVFHSFRLIFGRAIISWNGLEAWMLFPERLRAEHSC